MQPAQPRPPLLVVDGDNLAHRAYHSMPKSFRATDGRPANALHGFFSMLIRFWEEESPRNLFVAFDTLGVDTYRNRLWPTYQGGRTFDDEIVEQLERLPDLCRAFRFGVAKEAGYEADDLIAACALAEVADGGSCLILTTDRDTYQLASDRVRVLSPKRGTKQLDRIGPREVVERLQVLPEQVPDFKALAGDSSDRIPGIAGIGPKAAASLLLRFGNLEGVIAGWGRPASDSERALLFREVARMNSDVKVTLPQGPPDWRAGADALRGAGIAGVADRASALSG
jgi:DNA polymerase I